ncbi:class I SAM-dependent methyltransferase, partial [Patescibacteria group bacterium]|nr:class I SAM-dependent methyltransferase [Patescibacteria group bacterium]
GTKDNNTLDFGCGWGSFIFYAAHRSLGTFDGFSISQSQINFANEQSKSLSSDVSSRIQFFCEEFDGFRDGEVDIYDRVVSIGMLEHVGKNRYRRFFSEVNRLLKPESRGLFHTITRKSNGITNAWIDEHIFPGGYIPRPSEIVAGIEASGLNLVAYHRHDGTNYKRTLECWIKNLIQNELACLEILRENIEEATSHTGKTLGRQKISYQSRCGFRIWYFFLASIQCIFDRRGGAFDVTQFIVTKPSPEAY